MRVGIGRAWLLSLVLVYEFNYLLICTHAVSGRTLAILSTRRLSHWIGFYSPPLPPLSLHREHWICSIIAFEIRNIIHYRNRIFSNIFSPFSVCVFQNRTDTSASFLGLFSKKRIQPVTSPKCYTICEKNNIVPLFTHNYYCTGFSHCLDRFKWRTFNKSIENKNS